MLNRIGDNIVVFDFIRPAIAEKIFEKALGSVTARVKETNGLEVGLVPAAELARCDPAFLAWTGISDDQTIEARLAR